MCSCVLPCWLLPQRLVTAAAEQGSPRIVELLLSQPKLAEDKEELAESVERVLKMVRWLGSGRSVLGGECGARAEDGEVAAWSLGWEWAGCSVACLVG
jgi:hypothetical protein